MVFVKRFPKKEDPFTNNYERLLPGQDGEDEVGFNCHCGGEGTVFSRYRWDPVRYGWEVVEACEQCGEGKTSFVPAPKAPMVARKGMLVRLRSGEDGHDDEPTRMCPTCGKHAVERIYLYDFENPGWWETGFCRNCGKIYRHVRHTDDEEGIA